MPSEFFTKFKILLYLVFLFVFKSFVSGQDLNLDSLHIAEADNLFNKAKSLQYKNPDSAIVLFKQSYDYFLKNKSYNKAVSSLSALGNIYENKADYASSYDALWEALMITDNVDNEQLKSLIYFRLGRIYSYYKREEQSLDYLRKSLDMQKNMVERGVIKEHILVHYYYSLVSTNRELENFELAEKYLDSSFIYLDQSKTPETKQYLNFEKAYLLYKREEYTDALKLMESTESFFIENQPSYLVLVYKYWADIYFELSNYERSEEYYQKALKVSRDYNSHIDFTPLIYEGLTKISVERGDFEKAFEYQKKAKDLDAQFFDSRSSNNRSLLEIKDEYREEKERQERIIEQQHLKQLEQEERISSLRVWMLTIGIISILLLGILYFSHIRSKHRSEKELIRRNKQLEIKKAEELLELKNKELALSALQLIEKDEFLKTIKEKVRSKDNDLKTHEINKVLRSISISNNQSWEEFKLRFIEVNDSFYKEISRRFPDLSQNDQKICALIKLNFSSKEMARLLGISVESVHTKRYRLRKKMGLDKGINLEDYIASL